jgi:PAS domain S-box-containing protein
MCAFAMKSTQEQDREAPRRQVDEARLQAVLNTARDAIISIDRDGFITLFNRSAEEMFGYPAEEVLGKNVGILMPMPYSAEHGSYLQSYEKTGVAKAIGRVREVKARRKSGEVFPIELSVTEARMGEEVLYTAIIRDVSARQDIEELLRRERDLAERLIDTAPVLILVLDREGRIVRFNPHLEETTGYLLSEVHGRDWFEAFLPERDREAIRRVFELTIAGGVPHVRSSPIVTRSGNERQIKWRARTIRDSAGQIIGVLSIGEDVTEQQQAERRLAAQFAVTRALAEATSLSQATPRILQAICEGMDWDLGELWHVDRQANLLRWDGFWHTPSLHPADFEVISRSLRVSPGTGLPSRACTKGQPIWIPNLLNDPDFLRASIARKLRLRSACAFPLRTHTTVIGVMVFFLRKPRPPTDEDLDMIDAAGQQVAHFIERRHAEEALLASERRFAEFMSHLPGVAFMKDTLGRYIYVNEALEQLLAMSAEELRGKTDDEIWPPEVASEIKENDRRVMATRKVLQTIENLPHPEGPREWLASRFPILDDWGNPVMVAGVAIDITARRQAEAQVRELEKVAQQRERLADIGAITSQIVHDLGNPLAAISMQAQLIARRARRDQTQPVSTVLRPAEHIVNRVRDLDTLIREFLDFAREQRLKVSGVDLPGFLKQLADLWQPVAADRGIVLNLNLADGLPALTGDEEKLRRVFDNLVKNAVEAIDQGPGSITISAEQVVPAKVRISVADTGPGIAQGLEVFRLFGTTKPQGSGLGLAIVRQIVLAHGGGIEFASVEPHGTVFHVEFPCNGVPSSPVENSADRQ